MSIFNKNKAISPIIATVLLIAVAVILVTIILSWSRNYTNVSLNKTQDFGKLKVSDADSFVYPKSYSEGTMQFIYSPPESIKSEEIIITHYQILELPEVEPIPLAEPYNLRESTNILPLNCLYEYSLSSPDFTIQLITDKNTYITIKQRDPNMVCTSSGAGTEEDPKVICNAEELDDIRIVYLKYGSNLNLHYVLGKNIDLYCFSRQTEEGWEPIGTDYGANGFNGSFDGQNHTISNLYINKDDDHIGLFGFVAHNELKTIEIKNLILKDTNITGNQYVGSITGNFSMLAVISNVHSSGTINGGSYLGGLIGENIYGGLNNIGGDLNFSSFTGQINASGDYVGGLIGNNLGTIENSNSNIIINADGNYVGGIAGLNSGYIRKVYSKGSITSFGDYVGGVIGKNAKEIYDSYSLSGVSGNNYVGGLVGQNFKPMLFEAGGKIYNSYSAGLVIGNSNAGGLVGLNTNALISLSVYDTNTSEQSDTGKGEPKTTTEMKTQSTFEDWDFSSIWAMAASTNSGYPYLINNPPN